MAVYKCKESFCISKCDDNGFFVGEMIIGNGSLWKLVVQNYRFIGGEIRLENAKCEWIEIPKEWLKQYFKQVE